jgi:hypothetical protein
MVDMGDDGEVADMERGVFVIARDLAGLRKKAIEDNARGNPIFSGIGLDDGNCCMADVRPGPPADCLWPGAICCSRAFLQFPHRRGAEARCAAAGRNGSPVASDLVT